MCLWGHLDAVVDIMLNFLGCNVLAKDCGGVQVH